MYFASVGRWLVFFSFIHSARRLYFFPHRYEIFPSTGLKTLQTMKFSHDHKSMSMFINIKWTQRPSVDGETLVLRHVNCFRFIIIISTFFFGSCCWLVRCFTLISKICTLNEHTAFITINHFISQPNRNFINFYWKVLFRWEWFFRSFFFSFQNCIQQKKAFI